MSPIDMEEMIWKFYSFFVNRKFENILSSYNKIQAWKRPKRLYKKDFFYI